MRSRTIVGAIATATVITLVVAGLFAAGSPSTARKLKADGERLNRLTQLHYLLAGNVRSRGSLPQTLRQLRAEGPDGFGYGFDPRRDPETQAFFEYRKLSDRRYRVCATFLTSSKDRRSREFSYSGNLRYEPGRNCFSRTVSPDDEVRTPGPYTSNGTGAGTGTFAPPPPRPRPAIVSPAPARSSR